MKARYKFFAYTIFCFLIFSSSSFAQISQEDRLKFISLIRSDYYKTNEEVKSFTKYQLDSLEFFLKDGQIRKITSYSESGSEEYYFRPRDKYPYFLFRKNKHLHQEERYYFHSGRESTEFELLRLMINRDLQDTISDIFLEKGFFAGAKGRDLSILCRNFLFFKSKETGYKAFAESILNEFREINIDNLQITGDPTLEEHYGVAAEWNEDYKSLDGKITCSRSGSDVSCGGGHYENTTTCKTSTGLTSEEHSTITGPSMYYNAPWTYFARTSRVISVSKDGNQIRIQEETLHFQNKFDYTFTTEFLSDLE